MEQLNNLTYIQQSKLIEWFENLHFKASGYKEPITFEYIYDIIIAFVDRRYEVQMVAIVELAGIKFNIANSDYNIYREAFMAPSFEFKSDRLLFCSTLSKIIWNYYESIHDSC